MSFPSKDPPLGTGLLKTGFWDKNLASSVLENEENRLQLVITVRINKGKATRAVLKKGLDCLILIPPKNALLLYRATMVPEVFRM